MRPFAALVLALVGLGLTLAARIAAVTLATAVCTAPSVTATAVSVYQDGPVGSQECV